MSHQRSLPARMNPFDGRRPEGAPSGTLVRPVGLFNNLLSYQSFSSA